MAIFNTSTRAVKQKPESVLTEALWKSLEDPRRDINKRLDIVANLQDKYTEEQKSKPARKLTIDNREAGNEGPKINHDLNVSALNILRGNGPVTTRLIENKQADALFEIHTSPETSPETKEQKDGLLIKDTTEKIGIIREKSRYANFPVPEAYDISTQQKCMDSFLFPGGPLSFTTPDGLIYKELRGDSDNFARIMFCENFSVGHKEPYYFDETRLVYHHEIEGVSCSTNVVINHQTQIVLECFDNALLCVYKEQRYLPGVERLLIEESKELFGGSDIFDVSTSELDAKANTLFENLVERNPAFKTQKETIYFKNKDNPSLSFWVRLADGKFICISSLTDFSLDEKIKSTLKERGAGRFFVRFGYHHFERETRAILSNRSYNSFLKTSRGLSEGSFDFKIVDMIERFVEIKCIHEIANEIKSFTGSVE